MDFEFSTSEKIIFGNGKSDNLSKYIKLFGNKPFVIIDASGRYRDKFSNELTANDLEPKVLSLSGEPELNTIKTGVNLAKESKCDVVVSIGGGSVIDAGKSIAAFVNNPGEITDYLEVIGKGKPIANPSIPFIALPTTAGTGSEVTSNAVLYSPEHRVKVSIRSKFMFPSIALIDPVLSISMPPLITAASGLDAFVQLAEAYLSNKSNPFTDALCKEGLLRVSRSLLTAYNDGNDLSAREDMSLAGMFSGLALANAKLGSVHGIAGPLGGMLKIPHGIICANLFNAAFEVNLKALLSRNPSAAVLKRFTEISSFFIKSDKIPQKNGIDSFNTIDILKIFFSNFKIPSLRSYGFNEYMIPELIEKSKNLSSMKGNPIELKEEEIREILEKSIN